MADNLEVLIGGKWDKDLQTLAERLDETIPRMEQFAKIGGNLKISLGGADYKKSIQEAILLQKQMQAEFKTMTDEIKKNESAKQQAAKSQQEANKADKEAANVKTAQARAIDAQTKAELSATKVRDNSEKSIRAQAKAINDLAKERDKLEAKIAKEQEAIDKAKQPYNQLSATYNRVSKDAQNLGAEIELLKLEMSGNATPEYTAKLAILEEQYAETSTTAMRLHKSLLDIDQSVGKSQRNVGNYKSQWSGVNNSIQQLVREVPSTINNLAMLPLALSNNIGPLIDGLQQAKKANIELAEQGKKTIPVWKQVGAAIFSWQTLLMAGVAIVVLYSKEIVNFFMGISDAHLAAQKSLEKYNKTLKENIASTKSSQIEEITRLNALNDIATDVNLTQDQRINAVHDMQRLWPKTLGFLQQEAFLQGNVADQIDRTRKAIIANAKAEGNKESLIATAKELDAATRRQEAAQKAYDKFTGDAANQRQLAGNGNKTFDFLPGTAGNKLKKLTRELNESTDAVNKLTKAQTYYADNYRANIKDGTATNDVPAGSIAAMDKNISQLKERERLAIAGSENQKKITKERIAAEKELNKILEKNQPKVRGGKIPDLTNETLSAENHLTETLADINKARFELEAQKNKDIIDDEKQTVEKRLSQQMLYEANRLKIIDISRDKELQVVQNSLDKIDEIEAKPSNKRTNEEKRLLLNKEVLEAKKKEITQRYLYEEEKIISDSNEKRRGIIDYGMKEQLRIIMQGAQDIYNQVKESENRKLALLDDYAKANGWSEKKLQDERKKIIDAANLDLFDAQQTYFKNYLEDLEKQGAITKEVYNKIMDELSKPRPSSPKGDSDGLFAKMLKSIFGNIENGDAQKIVDTYINAAQQIISSIEEISNQLAEKKIKQHEAEIDRINEEYDLQLVGLKTTSKTEEEYNKKALQLKANAFLAQKKQEGEINAIKRKQAASDKVAAIGNVVENTGVAILSALATKAPAPVKAALAIAYGVIGAAQIARIAATPLPQYYTGTDSAKKGWAQVGERGAELVEGKKGVELVTTPSIKYLDGGEKIYNASETSEILKNGALKSLAASGQKVDEYVYQRALLEASERGSKAIVRAIQAMRPVTIEGVDPWRAENIRYKTRN